MKFSFGIIVLIIYLSYFELVSSATRPRQIKNIPDKKYGEKVKTDNLLTPRKKRSAPKKVIEAPSPVPRMNDANVKESFDLNSEELKPYGISVLKTLGFLLPTVVSELIHHRMVPSSLLEENNFYSSPLQSNALLHLNDAKQPIYSFPIALPLLIGGTVIDIVKEFIPSRKERREGGGKGRRG